MVIWSNGSNNNSLSKVFLPLCWGKELWEFLASQKPKIQIQIKATNILHVQEFSFQGLIAMHKQINWLWFLRHILAQPQIWSNFGLVGLWNIRPQFSALRSWEEWKGLSSSAMNNVVTNSCKVCGKMYHRLYSWWGSFPWGLSINQWQIDFMGSLTSSTEDTYYSLTMLDILGGNITHLSF